MIEKNQNIPVDGGALCRSDRARKLRHHQNESSMNIRRFNSEMSLPGMPSCPILVKNRDCRTGTRNLIQFKIDSKHKKNSDPLNSENLDLSLSQLHIDNELPNNQNIIYEEFKSSDELRSRL